MSYILDALRQSEQERRRAEGADAPAAPAAAGTGTRIRLPWLIGLGLGLNAVLVGALLWPQDEPARPPVEPEAQPTVQPETQSTAAVREPALAQLTRALSPASTPASTPATPQPSPAVVAEPAQRPLPLLDELPENFRRRLPVMDVNVHVFSEQPQARFALINLRRHQEGASLGHGVTLEEITPEGLVLSLDGRRFRVPVR